MSAQTSRVRRVSTTEAPWVRWTLIGLALTFLLLFLVLPLAAVFAEALRKGLGAYLDGLRGTGTRRSISDVDLLTPGGVVKAVNARGAIVMPRYLLSIDRFFENGARPA